MRIKNLTEDQLFAFSTVYASCMNGAGLGENWTSKTAEKYMRWFWDQKPDLCFVAMNDSEIAGGVTGLIKPYWNGNSLIEIELFVHESYRKQGIAKQLLTTLIEYALKKYAIVDICGFANKQVTFPLKWYTRLGLHETKWAFIVGDPKIVLDNLKK